MTDKELMQQALEALEEIADEVFSAYDNKLGEVILALRERLAQPEPAPGYCPHCKQYTIEEPMRREWVGLTEEEVDECYYWKGRQWTTDELVRHVEAKLKEKNA